MYTRKLVKSGMSSFVVALPKDYIVDNKLSKGSIVNIERSGKTDLVLTVGEKKREDEVRKIVIDMGKRPLTHVRRDIIEAYIKNYNELVIKLRSKQDAPIIKRFISYLVALEVVQEDAQRVVAKDFLNVRDREIERTVRRIEYIVGSMMDDLKLIEKDPDMAAAIMERDREVNKMGFLTMRVLQFASTDPEIASLLKLSPLQIMKLWCVNSNLEKIGDDVKRMGKPVKEMKPKELKTFYPLLDKTRVLFSDTCKAIHTKDVKILDSNLDKRNSLMLEFNKYLKSEKNIAALEAISRLQEVVSRLTDINRIYRYLAN